MTSGIHDLVGAYALDALDPSERAAFERHLDSCDDCRAELASFTAVAARLADASPASPPPGLRGRVLDEIARTDQVVPADAAPADAAPIGAQVTSLRRRRHVRVRPVAWLASAAAVALLVVGVVVVAGQRGGGNGVDDLLAAPDAVARVLDVAAADDSGSVEVIWSPGRDQVAVIASGVAPPRAGFVYELWAIAGGTPVPAGLFESEDGEIRAVVDLEDVEPEAWGITIEPAGGSPAPTGEILYFAEV